MRQTINTDSESEFDLKLEFYIQMDSNVITRANH